MTVGPVVGDGLGFKVTPDNVLGAYAAIKEEAQRLGMATRNFQLRIGRVDPCGGDPVSKDAAGAFGEACGLLAQKCGASIAQLEAKAEELAKTARSYGLAEEQIMGAFDQKSYAYQPTPIQRSGGQR